MKKRNNESLHSPARQSPVAIGIILLKFIRNIVRTLWPILLVYLLRRDGASEDDYFAMAVLVLSGFTVISSIAAFFKFYYYVEGDQLVIEKGILQKKKISVPVERVQSINFEQQLLHQLFDVVAVKVDTAGSSNQEISLDAVTKQTAQTLKRYIFELKGKLTQDDPLVEMTEVEDQDSRQERLVKLDIGDLIKVGVSQNHFQTAALIIAFGFGFLDDLSEVLGINIIDRAEESIQSVQQSNFIIFLLAIPILLFISILITLVRTVFSYYDFSLWKTSKGFETESGLLTKKQKHVSLRKLQLIHWRQNPIEKIFGMMELRLKQASSTEMSASQSMQVPGAYPLQVEQILSAVLPRRFQEKQDEFGIHHSIVPRGVFFFGILPSIPIGFTLSRQYGLVPGLILASVYILIVYLAMRRYHRTFRIRLSPRGIIAARGIYSRKHTALDFVKVQAVSISQSFHERRHGQSSLHLSTASGSLTLPYIDLKVSHKIANYALYYVERSRLPWM